MIIFPPILLTMVAECHNVEMPDTFYSFSGRSATNIGNIIHINNVHIFIGVLVVADCSWDFFRCTERYGTWPDNKVAN